MILDSLLHSLYNSFDKDPHTFLALRISHTHGFSWVIVDRVLTASTETEIPLGIYPLENYTLLALAHALRDAGCTVVYQSPDNLHLSAATLVAGQGVESSTNGDHLLAYTSLLWVVLDAFALALEKAGLQIPNAIREINYAESDGQFTDYWANWWGIPRILGETDQAFKDRTVYEIIRPKDNPYVMGQTLQHIFGDDFHIREPWKEVMYLSESALDDDKHCQGMEWIYHTAQVVAWSKNLLKGQEVAQRDRPAGTILLDPWLKYPGAQLPFPDADIKAWEEWLLAYYINIGLQGILSENLFMSDYDIDYSVQIAIGELMAFANELGLNLYSTIYKHLFCRGEIILSDSDPIETLQAHFGGRMKVCNGSHQIMSEAMGLSDSDFKWHWQPIDVWIDDDHHLGLFEWPLDRDVTDGLNPVYGASTKISRGIRWTGGWNTRKWQDGLYMGMAMN